MAIIDKPSDYFNTVLYTGNGSDDHSITGVNFQPDFVWIKNRDDTWNHALYDSVRTATKKLESDTTDVEATLSNGLKSFNSDGFTFGTSGTSNASGEANVSWNWKAGTNGSGTTTGNGTGKAYSYSVSTTSGFSIIKYVGNGTAGHTIPHHLGAVPKMIIVKDLAAVSEFKIYHAKLANTEMLVFSNQAKWTSRTEWNSTTPTSTVFSLGNQANVNTNDRSYIAYCFAEKQGYSKFGSYTGNGNADGTFVYLGFKPAFLMRKRTDSTGRWVMEDNKRDTYNVVEKAVAANINNAEGTGGYWDVDFTAQGFKVRNNDVEINASGGSYIYMAFAENPFVTSTGVPATAR